MLPKTKSLIWSYFKGNWIRTLILLSEFFIVQYFASHGSSCNKFYITNLVFKILDQPKSVPFYQLIWYLCTTTN